MTFDPKTNRIPRALLTNEERVALAEACGPYERWHYASGKWVPEKQEAVYGDFWTPEAIIRQAAPYTGIWMSKQLLDVLDPKRQWFARDEDGNVYCFKHEPFICGRYWDVDVNNAYGLISEIYTSDHFDPGTCDWRESLVSREDLKSRAGDRR